MEDQTNAAPTAPAEPRKDDGFSLLSDLNAVTACAVPFEFEYRGPDGLTGLFFKVLGVQAEAVQTEINRLMSELRRENAILEAKAAKARDGAVIRDPKADVRLNRAMAACRLVGWRRPGETEGLSAEQKARFRGIKEPYSPELAYHLMEINADLMQQTLDNSNELGNFMKVSAPGS